MILTFRMLAVLVGIMVVISHLAAQEFPATDVLAGTAPLDWDEPLDVRMMRGAHQFVARKIQEEVAEKNMTWTRNTTSVDAYNRSLEPKRKRLQFLLGAGNLLREPHTHIAFPVYEQPVQMQRIGDDDVPAVLYQGDDFRVTRVRWQVLAGVFGEGLLLEPAGEPTADVIVIPDADQSPEQLVGLVAGTPLANQLPRRLAIGGARVIVPVLIDRRDVAGDKRLGQSNREWIYRQAFHMGRHILGYEIDKVTAAIDWLEKTGARNRRIGIAGWGEGGLLAFYTAALDTRIDTTLVSGDWQHRGESWREPIYRNVWSLMKEFDDADIATMIAPRALIVEPCREPTIDFVRDKAMPADVPRLSDYPIHDATSLVPQFAEWFVPLPQTTLSPIAYGEPATAALASLLRITVRPVAETQTIAPIELSGFIAERHNRQLLELDDYTQRLVRDSESVREDFYLNRALPHLQQRKWSTEAVHPTTPLEEFTNHSDHYRDMFYSEILGKFDDPLLPANPRSRKIRQTDHWVAYDVVLDVVPEMFAWGVLMLPKMIRVDEKHPVVVVQHGRGGLPEKVMEGGYNGIAEKLLSRGFIVFAPHNLYRGEDEYRWLDRKANAIGKSLFSFLLLQHDQITRWLSSLPQVDGDRIAFYGNSYGGESAVRIPTVLTKYALSICASDFNDWTRKVADTHNSHSFMRTIEWEMPYFNMGNTFSYAEMAYLMVPRPFMVERGHHDLVAPDHWVASEYAKVRLVYDQLGLGDRTAITFFQGGHTMRGDQTVTFLERHLGGR